jgi:dienelactone hydrolase
MALPYHLERTPKGFNSGDLAILPDTQNLKENLTQAVLDCRRALDFLGQRPEIDSTRLGVSGVSLGAIVSGLVYGVDSRLNRAAFVLGGVDLAHILWKSTRVVSARDVLRGKGYTEEKLRAELIDIEPANLIPDRKDDSVGKTLVVQARFDTVIPAKSSNELIAALGNPAVLRIDTGHYGGVLVQRRILREVARYFTVSFKSEAYVAPERLYAPTLRIGVLSSTNARFDLGLGLDLWRLDRENRSFTSLFATPRGLQFVVGRRIDRGISVGVNAGSHGVGVGIFWSSIL